MLAGMMAAHVAKRGAWEIAGTEYPEFFKCSHVASGLTKDDAEAFCFLANTYGHA